MKKVLRMILYLVLVVVIALVVVVAYIKLALPNVGDALNMKVELTHDRMEHGKYLAHNVAVCMDCHSTRDWGKFAGPIQAGTLGAGGEVFDQKIGFPGSFTSKNITPHALADWTDGEIFRAITAGVDRNNKALFPIMPYHHYGKVDKEDIYDIIAYIRSIESVKSEISSSRADFPMNIIIHLMPKKPQFIEKPDKSDKLKYGEYMTTLAGCLDCHTPMEKGKPDLEKAFSGGVAFPLPTGGTVYSSNITPDKETGIGSWTEDAFIRRFKLYEDSVFTPYEIASNQFNTVMPWTMYDGMKDDDLAAVYTYLKSLEPLRNKVVRFEEEKTAMGQ